MNFILFSGPPRSGKDTGAKIVTDFIAGTGNYRAHQEKFSFPNKRAFAGLMNVKCDEFGVVTPHEAFKDIPDPVLGVSYRQWQIDVSEKFMKVLYGQDVFARLLLDRCLLRSRFNPLVPIFVVSDCGFDVEVHSLANHDVLMFQMVRDGCTYKNDSRSSVAPLPHWLFYNVNNNGTEEETGEFLNKCVSAWLP